LLEDSPSALALTLPFRIAGTECSGVAFKIAATCLGGNTRSAKAFLLDRDVDLLDEFILCLILSLSRGQFETQRLFCLKNKFVQFVC